LRGLQKQKTGRRSAPRNRYVAGAKLSEHKFLRILHGYAEGLPIKTLEPTTHVSGKTIRSTYRALRCALPGAMLHHPERFGYAGLVLAADEAGRLRHAVQRSRTFNRYRKHQAPRLSCPVEEGGYVTEKIARLLCALDLRELSLTDKADAVGALIEALCEAIPRLHPREPHQHLADFIPDARPFAYNSIRFYGDYRRYLLKSPLGSNIELI